MSIDDIHRHRDAVWDATIDVVMSHIRLGSDNLASVAGTLQCMRANDHHCSVPVLVAFEQKPRSPDLQAILDRPTS
jgi:hypothetical protein